MLIPLLAMLAVATPAAATPYPPAPPTATVNIGTVGSGGTVQFTATGFLGGEQVSVSVSYTGATLGLRLVSARRDVVATVTADSGGTITLPLTLTTPGTATITATGLTSGVTVSTTVTIADGAGAAGLPVTGGTPGGLLRNLLLAGTGAVLVGAWLVAWMLRRRRAGTAPA
ncbi:hypothetical protein [Pilimelia anulata]|uniref:hypothetical protein n=1 Tax=Pilimelia anulata TaxID=53371 RepID=UPI001E345CCC|nr:hypothetical protein [Pilimelia anulata]